VARAGGIGIIDRGTYGTIGNISGCLGIDGKILEESEDLSTVVFRSFNQSPRRPTSVSGI
jgi:hypothetical protein